MVMPFPAPPSRAPQTPATAEEPNLQGFGVPVRVFQHGDIASEIQFQIDRTQSIGIMNAAKWWHPWVWNTVEVAIYTFAGFIDRQLCKTQPCVTCHTKKGVLEDWKTESVRYKGKGDYVAAFWRFIGGVVTAHGYLLQQEAKPLAPVPTDRLEQMLPIDPLRQPPDAMAGPLWVANHLFDRMLQNRPVFLACDTRRHTDAYRTGKTSLVVQVAYYLGQLIHGAGYGPRWDMRHDMVFEHDEPRLRERIEDDTEWKVWVIDEFLILYKRDAMTKRIKSIIRALPTKPKQRQAVLMAGPNIIDLDKHIVGNDLTHRLKVTRSRSEAVLYEKRGTPPDELLDQWGDQVVPIGWDPLPETWERLYDGPYPSLVKIARDMEEDADRSPIADYLSKHPDFGTDLLTPLEVRQVV